MPEYLRPRPIAAGDIASEFASGVEALDRWLRALARHNEASGGSRTYVSVTADTNRIAGYYCLSASSIHRADAPGPLARNMPDPIPVALLGRLAVDQRDSGQGLGVSLLQHAVLQAVRASETLGLRALIVHAVDERAVSFYERYGFTRFPDGSTRVLYLRVVDALQTAAAISR